MNNEYKYDTDIKVLTNKKIRSISELLPGDKVYSITKSPFDSGKYLTRKLEVEYIKNISYEMIYEIMYSDGRSQLVGCTDKIYLGHGISNVIKYPTKRFEPRYISEIEMPVFNFDEIKNHGEIPSLSDYIFENIHERQLLIRSYFDKQHDDNIDPLYNSITDNNENRLKIIQKILWSLGIPSSIQYQPNYKLIDELAENNPNLIYMDSNNKYILYANLKYQTYPGLHYDINYIKNMISNDYGGILRFPYNIITNKFCIQYINLLGPRNLFNIKFKENSGMIYYTDTFLPRVSL